MPILGTFCQKFDQEKFCSKEESLEITALQIKASQWSITTNRRPLTTHIYHVMIIVTGGQPIFSRVAVDQGPSI